MAHASNASREQAESGLSLRLKGQQPSITTKLQTRKTLSQKPKRTASQGNTWGWALAFTYMCIYTHSQRERGEGGRKRGGGEKGEGEAGEGGGGRGEISIHFNIIVSMVFCSGSWVRQCPIEHSIQAAPLGPENSKVWCWEYFFKPVSPLATSNNYFTYLPFLLSTWISKTDLYFPVFNFSSFIF